METMNMEKIADIKTPDNQVIELLGGKKAIVGPITLDVMVWIEGKYGTFDEFQKTLPDRDTPAKDIKIGPLASFLYQMLQNKDEFASESEFLRSFPMTKIIEIAGVITKQMAASMPAVDPKAALSGGAGGEEKK